MTSSLGQSREDSEQIKSHPERERRIYHLFLSRIMPYHVYILTNQNHTVLYTGMTGDIVRRIHEHKNNLIDGFSRKYRTHLLVYTQEFSSPEEAIIAEKKIKWWTRKRKIGLINTYNPGWRDLSGQM